MRKNIFVGKAKYLAWDTPDEDEHGFVGPKRKPRRPFTFNMAVQLTLSEKSKEEGIKDFWALESLRLYQMMKQWKNQ